MRHGRMRGFTKFAACATLIAANACGSSESRAGAGVAIATSGIAAFEVDPTWPREMPNDWVMGAVTGVFVDAQDHVWVTHLVETLTPEAVIYVGAESLKVLLKNRGESFDE